MNKLLPVDEFYNDLSDGYDRMTNDNNRWKTIIEDYNKLFDRLEVRSVLDLGCGTGGEAIELTKTGCEVVGVDISAEFIDIAIEKAKKDNVKTEFFVADFRDLSALESREFDAVICRGNTLPHLQKAEDLKQAFRQFAEHAKPGGMLVLEWLNYDKILENKDRLVGVSGDDRNVFMRFYDFSSPEEIVFNIVRHQFYTKWSTDWQQTVLKPWLTDDVGIILRQSGWHKLRIYSNIKMDDFEPKSSKNVLLTARREYETMVG